MHSMPLTHSSFWVQLHGVPGFYMTFAVAQAIDAMFGDVIRVDNRDGSDCVGCFIRLRVRFDATLPFIGRTLVTFFIVGEKMVEFKYEYLPDYCFACGRLGHSTHVCIKKYETTHGPLTPSLHEQLSYVFADLEGTTNPRLFPTPSRDMTIFTGWFMCFG